MRIENQTLIDAGRITDETVFIPDEVLYIHESAFRRNKHIVDVRAKNVVAISNHAFYGCEKLEVVRMKQLSYIGAYAFCRCPKLQEIQSTKIHTIKEAAFNHCPKLDRITAGGKDYRVGVHDGLASAISSTKTLRSKDFDNGVSLSETTYGDPVIHKGRFLEMDNNEFKQDFHYIAYKPLYNSSLSAHGYTAKEAIDALIKKFMEPVRLAGIDIKDINFDTKKTVQGWVDLYVALTGACGPGVDRFVAALDKNKKSYTLREIAQMTKHEYGGNLFTRLFYTHNQTNLAHTGYTHERKRKKKD